MRRSSCPNILEGLRGLYSSRAAITKINQGVETTQENWDMILWQRLDLFREPLDQTRDPRRQGSLSPARQHTLSARSTCSGIVATDTEKPRNAS